jgi:hypothetical protein
MTYPDQGVDYVVFPEPLVCRFTRPVGAWNTDDNKFRDELNKKYQEEAKGQDLSASQHHYNIRENLSKCEKEFGIHSNIEQLRVLTF